MLALVLPLVAQGPGAPASQSAPYAQSALADKQYRSIVDEFEAAQKTLAMAKNADELAESGIDLVGAFNARLRPLADGGHGPSIGWILGHFAKDSRDPRDEATIRNELWARVLPSQAGAEWLWYPEIELLDRLAADIGTLGRSQASGYARSVYEALPPAQFERRLRALSLEAGALAPLGEPDREQRRLAAEVWQRELAANPASPLALAAERALWRLSNVVIGRTLGPLCSVDVDGNQVCLEDFEGKVVVLGFFSFSRSGDRARAEALARLQTRFEHSPFTVFGVNQDSNQTLFRKLSEECELRFPCVFEGGRNGRVASALQLDEPPRILVLDRHGVLRFVDLDDQALEAAVADLIAEPTGVGRLPRPRSPNR